MDCPRVEFREYEVLVINPHPLRVFLPRKGLKNQPEPPYSQSALSSWAGTGARVSNEGVLFDFPDYYSWHHLCWGQRQ